MKTKFTHIKLRYWPISLFLITFFIIPLSCKKNHGEESQHERVDPQSWMKRSSKFLEKDFISKKYSQSDLQTNVNSNIKEYSLSWKIEWAEPLDRINKDSIQYIYVPMKAYYKLKESELEQPATIINYKRYLLITCTPKDLKYSIAYTFDDDIKEKKDSNLNAKGFSGKIAFKSLENNVGVFSSYQQDKSSPITPMESTSPSTGCYNVYLCSWGVLCNGRGVNILGIIAYGNCTTPSLSEVQNQLYGCTINGPINLNSSEFLRRECAPGSTETTPQPPIPPPSGGTGGDNGGIGAPGGDAPPAAARNLTTVYGFGGQGANSDDGRLSCKSFKFTRVGNGNSQEAGISNLTFVVQLPNGNVVRIFQFRTMYINMGINQANGNIISPGKAAEYAAHAANLAGASLTTKYMGFSTPEQINAILSSQVESDFKELFQICLTREVQGYAAVNYTASNNSIVVSKPVWNGPIVQIFNWLGQAGCEN